MEVPPHLASEEFFEEVFQKLAPGGWLIAVGGDRMGAWRRARHLERVRPPA